MRQRSLAQSWRRCVVWIPLAASIACAHAPTRLGPVQLRRMDAPEFVELLRGAGQGWITLDVAVQDWPPRESLPFLVSLLGDESPAPIVLLSTSSYLGSGRSTIGREVAYLLLGIEEGRYPPRANSAQVRDDERQRVERWARRVLEKQRARQPTPARSGPLPGDP